MTTEQKDLVSSQRLNACGQEDLVRFRRTAESERVRAPEFVIGGAELATLSILTSLESLKISRKKQDIVHFSGG